MYIYSSFFPDGQVGDGLPRTVGLVEACSKKSDVVRMTIKTPVSSSF